MARLHARTISQRLSKADKPDAAGWSWGYCSAVTQNGWLGSLTPVPNRIGLKSYIRLSLRPEEAERFWKIEPAVGAAIVVSFAG